MIFYTNWFVRDGFAGTAYGPVAFIRPQYRDDIGLRVHEQTHIRQFITLRYYFMKKLEREVEAFKAQIACYPDDRTEFLAGFMSANYGFGITTEQAITMLRRDNR